MKYLWTFLFLSLLGCELGGPEDENMVGKVFCIGGHKQVITRTYHTPSVSFSVASVNNLGQETIFTKRALILLLARADKECP